jgi:hypothetical protein
MTISIAIKVLFHMPQGRHDTQHNGIQHNYTEHNNIKALKWLNSDTKHKALNTECCFAEHHCLILLFVLEGITNPLGI